MAKKVQTPKGFRDIGPELAAKRRSAVNKIVAVLEEFDFVPIETPTIEFAQTLKGKYGEEERLIYEFTDRGGRELALRYDLTVPLARYVATYNPPLPFRRYQIGQVFRGEKPQRGRFREFTQLDFDSMGSGDVTEDARIIAAALESAKKIGVVAKMRINDRATFDNLISRLKINESIKNDVIRVIDKIEKLKLPDFLAALMRIGLTKEQADGVYNGLSKNPKTPLIGALFEKLKEYKFKEGVDFVFDPSLARGLDYYTSTIFELEALEVKGVDNGEDLPATVTSYKLSIGGGGRYDSLIGMFGKTNIPAVGFSFGLDRLIESLG